MIHIDIETKKKLLLIVDICCLSMKSLGKGCLLTFTYSVWTQQMTSKNDNKSLTHTHTHASYTQKNCIEIVIRRYLNWLFWQISNNIIDYCLHCHCSHIEIWYSLLAKLLHQLIRFFFIESDKEILESNVGANNGILSVCCNRCSHFNSTEFPFIRSKPI